MLLSLHAASRFSLLTTVAVRYLIATCLSACITIGLPILLVEIGTFHPSNAAATALLVALVVNFLSLKLYVYRKDGNWQAQAARFLVLAALFRLCEYGGFLLLHHIFGWFYVAALILTMGLSFVAKFLIYHFLIFSSQAEDPRDGLRLT